MHDSLSLYITNDTFTLEPTATSVGGLQHECLVITRETTGASFSLTSPPPPTLRQETVLSCLGLIGIIRLNAGEHLLLATDRERVGMIQGHAIYKLTQTKIVPVPRSRLHLSDSQLQDDDKYLTLLEDMLSRDYFYFSYTFDLTNSVQRQARAAGDGTRIPFSWNQCDDRFFWNKELHKKLIDITAASANGTGAPNDLGNFILPIVCGFVFIKPLLLTGKQLTYSLISRRSRFRAGTRFNMRGIDDSGNVANFVETEQIVSIPNRETIASFVQTRGSIPLYWRQIPCIKYTPRLVVYSNPSTADSFRKHFAEQFHFYGTQIIAIHLANSHGYEEPLAQGFARHASLMADPRLRYLHFDFHKECSKMRWDRIRTALLPQISADLEQHGYTHVDDSGRLVRVQSGAVRTNCVDCLDRTNVVQSVIARVALTRVLRDLDFKITLSPDASFFLDEEFERVFKNVWADNADAVSNQYSGTGALKTDYTRTGKRSTMGLLNDGMNSAVRYFKNNFFDGFRQDTFDLFLGRYVVHPSQKSPFIEDAERKNALIMFVSCLVGISISIFTILYLWMFSSSSSIVYWIFYNLVSVGVAFGCVQVILKNGEHFTDKPRLAGGKNRDYVMLPPMSKSATEAISAKVKEMLPGAKTHVA
ncbi:MAG: hypothetical protein SGCHY_000017 [Lobulomycetales sp.]